MPNTKIRLVRHNTTVGLAILINKKQRKMKKLEFKNLILTLMTWMLVIGMYMISESKEIQRHNENNETRLENIELRRQLDFHKNVIRILEENGKDVEQAERDVRGW